MDYLSLSVLLPDVLQTIDRLSLSVSDVLHVIKPSVYRKWVFFCFFLKHGINHLCYVEQRIRYNICVLSLNV